MAKTLGVEQFLQSRKKVMPFEGEWRAAFGCPAYSGTWIVWGMSGSGKTRFALQLIKELTKFGRCAYDSLEEGDRVTVTYTGTLDNEDPSPVAVAVSETEG